MLRLLTMRDRLVIGLHHPGLLLGVDVGLEAGVSRRDERVYLR